MMAVPQWLPAGTVYGTLLNFRREHALWAPRMSEAPYKAAPKAPVLYVKTANTWTSSGGTVPVPARVPEVEVGATIGMVIGDDGRAAGCVLMNDFSVPHASFFRPPVKFKCLDGFLGIGSALRTDGDPDRFALEVRIDGELRHTADFSQLVRPAKRLLAEVGEFMTLRAGDVLMLGCNAGRPLARVGQRIEITAPGFEPLVNTLEAEAA